MTSQDEPRNSVSSLRQRAEDMLRGKPADLERMPLADIRSLLHELQVYQAELSVQNDELRRIQLDLETARDMYSDLYNFAPAGYCTIDHKDHILEANETLAALLGVERRKLINNTFSHYVDRQDQDKYYLHRQGAVLDHQPHVSEICLVKQTGEKIAVRLESVIAHSDKTRIRMMVSDITGLRRLEKEAQDAEMRREFQNRLSGQREKERQQMARDLHDGPMQGLIAILFDLHGIIMDFPDPELAQKLKAIQVDLQARISELRDYAMELRPPTLAKFGLEAAIRSHADLFRKKHPQIHLKLVMDQTGDLLSEPVRLALFRIYQEALANINRHTQAKKVEVTVRMEKDERQVRLEIEDNGPGFSIPENWIDLVREGHLGLMGMRERAEALGGQLEIRSKKGEGTTVVVTVSLDTSQPEGELYG